MTDAQITLGVSCDPAAEMEERIVRLLWPAGGEPSPVVDPAERALLHVLRERLGKKNAIQIRHLAQRLDLTPREVKAAARGLVMKTLLPIVGLRQPPYGYFVALDNEEVQAGRLVLMSEVRALIERLLASGASAQDILRMVQKALDGEKEEGDAA